jgi:radical SAM protein with 4Fe4S-binding SPASM domain
MAFNPVKKIKVLSNCLKSIYNYKRRKINISNLPTLLWIEPTNKCNLKCVMCPNIQIPKDMLGFMSWDTYKRVIDEAREFASSIYLLLAGESLLHKDIYKMIRYAKGNNIRPLLNTNGTPLISEDNRIKLLESGIAHITFAFDGYNKETYEKVRIGAEYDKVINGIVEFLREKKSRGLKEPYIAITTLEVGIEDYENKEKAKRDFYKLFEGLPVDEFILKTPNTWGGTFTETERFSHHEIVKGKIYPCSHLWSTMSICWDGTVVPCCFDFFKTYTLGNVNKKSLEEIWNDQPMTALRESMLNGSYKDLNKLCNGCVILHLDPVLGVPAGMRTAVKDAITNLIGMNAEKHLIRFAKKIKPSYSLKIDR